MRGLDLIFGKSSLIAVLRVLFSHRGTPLSGRQIQRLAGLSNRAAMLALDELETLRVLRVDRLARGHAYLLNEENYFVLKALRPALESEVYFWEDLGKTIRRRVHPRPVAAVATGPLVQGLRRPFNDVSRGCSAEDIVDCSAMAAITEWTE